MGTLRRLNNFFHAVILLLAVVVITTSTTSQGTISQAVDHKPLDICTFSNGNTMTFGHKALPVAEHSPAEQSEDVWITGEYVATAFHADGDFAIPSNGKMDEIPAGDYTLFFTNQGTPPWTLIISKKSGQWGMAYPGERYDIVRGTMGSDVLHPPVDHPIVGCWQSTGPTFLWMESGRYAAYAKIEAEKMVNGKAERVMN
jgi:hypothetical protein